MVLENVKCPVCGKAAKHDFRAGTHVCSDLVCGWRNKELCAYPACKSTSLFPSKFCFPHREWGAFIAWVYNDVLKGTKDNVKTLNKLVKGD